MDRKLLLILLFEMIGIGNGHKCPECLHISGHWEECSLKRNEDWVDKEISKMRIELEEKS